MTQPRHHTSLPPKGLGEAPGLSPPHLDRASNSAGVQASAGAAGVASPPSGGRAGPLRDSKHPKLGGGGGGAGLLQKHL